MKSVEEMQQATAEQQANEERRASILDQILEPKAKERISRLSLVKKDKARMVEDSLIKAATTGRLQGKVTEEQLIAMLEQIGAGGGGEEAVGGGSKSRGVTIQRRKYGMDDDDDDNDDELA